MLKGLLLGILVTVAVILGGGYLLIRSGAVPANADAAPGAMEKYVALTSLRATLRKEAPKEKDPVALTPDNLLKGIHLFATHCAICHGTAAGNASPSWIAKGEYPAPPQLASAGVEDDPAAWTFWKIKHGIRWTGMPSWKYELNDHQIWTLALFLKHMNKLPPRANAAWHALSRPTQ